MNLTHPRPLVSFGLAALVSLAVASTALAQAVAPPLGRAGSYTVLGTNGIPTTSTVTCTNSTIDGDVGTTGTSVAGACTTTGVIDAPVDAEVVDHFDDAYAALPALNPVCDGVVPTTTTTLAPGVYCSAAGTTIGAGVTITLDGDADDVWVFRIGTGGLGALTGTGPNLNVVMGGTAQACNVYWWTAEAATMTNATFAGTVLSGTAATMTGTTWEGRALATTDVTLTDSTITGCAAVAPCPDITIAPATIPGGTPGFFYSQTLTASGGTPEYTFVRLSGTLPPGLTLSATGTLSGTPTTPGSFTFTVQATDDAGCQSVQTYTFINAAATNIPALDWLGMALMMVLLGAAAVFAMNRLG